jgi:YVTN family beta-propeller protein
MRKNRRNFLLHAITCAALTLSVDAQVEASAQEAVASGADLTQRLPAQLASGGADLPNGWRITPAGKLLATVGDLVTNVSVSPDGRVLVVVNSGFQPHGLTVFDARTHAQLQHIALPSAWLGLAWSSDGRKLYVSGGNASGGKNASGLSLGDPANREGGVGRPNVAPIYEFAYADGRLSEAPIDRFVETIDPKQVWWSGVSYLQAKHLLYAANRGTGRAASNVVVFDADTRKIITRIPVEVSPYQTLLSPDGKRLFVSNWSSDSVSVIDTETNQVIRTIAVGDNPNDMKLSADGRLFVACSNDNTVHVIDTKALRVIERISTTLTPMAPTGSTPNALAIDDAAHRLYVANADNNNAAVVNIESREHSNVAGFIPTGWYPSALALADRGRALFIGSSKGWGGQPTPKTTPLGLAALTQGPLGDVSIRSLQNGGVEALSVADLKAKLPGWTRQVIENTPYRDSLLSEAPPSKEPSVIPRVVGQPSPIKHIIYVIKENRTYDHVFGDLPQGNGDPNLAIFGEKVTPNHHALARDYVLFDNLYCDGEVSVDGHAWSTAAYATDFLEKQWPAVYGRISNADLYPEAVTPSSGFLWDLAKRKGLTYRTYGEGTNWTDPVPLPGMEGLSGHIAPGYIPGLEVRDVEKLQVFLRELKDWDANFDSADPGRRLPNLITMTLPNDHTSGTRPGAYTPTAMVADNDYALGQLVEAVSHSKYWPETAIFVIEDDAQDGPDHVDGRRTVGLVISPYVKRGKVDRTLYSTSSMLRSMELLLGLPPMSQYDAAAMPMYAAFGATPVVSPFTAIKPSVDMDARNKPDAYGAAESARMNLAEVDRAPMRRLNEIVWKSVRGADSEMPAPVHRFRPLVELADDEDGRD